MPPDEDSQTTNNQIADTATQTEAPVASPEKTLHEGDAGSATAVAADALTAEPADDLPTDKPASARMKALLDELSGDALAGQASDDASAAAASADAAMGAAEEASRKAGGQAPDAAPEDDKAKPATPETEEAELLEGVKSDRGRERIREVFAQKKQLEQDIAEFRDLVTSTKMSPEQFAQTLEFGRLINSGAEQDLRVALEMIEQQRAELYQRLGVEAPGVDLLAGHDDLKAAVDNMEITRDRALELAKYRKQDADTRQRQQAQQQTQVQQAQFQQTVQQAATAMETYLESRAKEVDHPVRMKAILQHFGDPANLQAFVQTYQPQQWMATIKMMYDSVQVPRSAPPSREQPLRTRPATLGNPQSSGQTPIDRIAAHMDNLGL